MLSRRGFIKKVLLGTAAAQLGTYFLLAYGRRMATSAALTIAPQVLIVIFQRGAMDGLMAVCPYTDPFLKAARPHLFMEAGAPGDLSVTDRNIDLDGRFGLHPSFSSLAPLFQDKQLAIIHGAGLTYSSRSHFDAQDYMESGFPGQKNSPSGWLNRAMSQLPVTPGNLKAVALSTNLPRSLSGDYPAVAISNLDDFKLKLPATASNIIATLKATYDNGTPQIKAIAQEAFSASDTVQKNRQVPGKVVTYPKTGVGNSLQQMATLIKADIGLRVGALDSYGWDTHVNEGTLNGAFSRPAKELGQALAAFWNDLGDYRQQVLVVTMTEFGRTMAENGALGTDHGRGSCMFVLGSKVAGGRVYGQVPSLETANLEDKRDLPVTTDYRTVLAEILTNHMGLAGTKAVFPDLKDGTVGLFA